MNWPKKIHLKKTNTGKLPKKAHGNGSTCISENRLTALMKKIFAEALEKQKQIFSKLICGNFEIKNIKFEVNELKKASNLQRRFLKRKVGEIYDYQIDPDKVEKKLTDLEDRLRTKNILKDGVTEEND